MISSERKILAVINEKAGNGKAIELGKALERPNVTVITFLELLANADILVKQHDEIFSAGGDGTNTTVANIARKQGKVATFADMGGVGVLAKTLGCSKHPWESYEQYADRLLALDQEVSIPPGLVTLENQSSKEIVSMGGAGFFGDMLKVMELLRLEERNNKYKRFIRTAVQAFKEIIPNADPLEVYLGWQKLGIASEATVIKSPFVPKAFGTEGKDALCLLPQPERNPLALYRAILMVILSVLAMPFGVKPRGNGLQVIPLEPGQIVTVRHADLQPHIDSELSKTKTRSFSVQPQSYLDPYLLRTAA